MITKYNCLYCRRKKRSTSESHVVFCNEACLREYMDDAKDGKSSAIEEFGEGYNLSD